MAVDAQHDATIRVRFSHAGFGGRWSDLYDTETPRVDEYSFRLRCEFAVARIKSGLPRGGRVLDLGCGSAPVLARLRQAGIDCAGLDYSSDMLDLARRRLRELGLDDGGLQQGDFACTAFSGSSFDAIVCLGVISYAKDYAVALREMHRLLKPGGFAVISSRSSSRPSLSDPIALAKRWGRRLLGRDRPEPFEFGRFLDQGEVSGRLEASGFVIEHFEGIGFGPFSIGGWQPFSGATSIRISDALTRLFRATRFDAAFRRMSDVNIWVCRRPSP
jgi:SAM-dependent methyltransferase